MDTNTAQLLASLAALFNTLAEINAAKDSYIKAMGAEAGLKSFRDAICQILNSIDRTTKEIRSLLQ